MKIMRNAIVLASALSVVGAVSCAAGPVEDRKELMKSVKEALKVAVPMAKGETPFDAAAASNAMKTINSVPDKFVKLFPEGSQTHKDTTASPKIWENMQDFQAKANGLKEASAAAMEAAGKGQEEFKAAVFGSLVKACKNCHETYRIKKDK